MTTDPFGKPKGPRGLSDAARRLNESAKSFTAHGLTFDGPYTIPDLLDPKPGIYLVLDKLSDDEWRVLDVGESRLDVRERLRSHDRKEQWKSCRKGYVYVAAAYTPGLTDEQRCELERKIRLAENPPCGER